MKHVPLFLLIQLINALLFLPGVFICLSPALAKATWIYWNDDDGSGPGTSWWSRYTWLAWRNPVDNLKHWKWTQRPGPLYYRTWIVKGKQLYFKCGWMSDSYACLSFGGGRGY